MGLIESFFKEERYLKLRLKYDQLWNCKPVHMSKCSFRLYSPNRPEQTFDIVLQEVLVNLWILSNLLFHHVLLNPMEHKGILLFILLGFNTKVIL